MGQGGQGLRRRRGVSFPSRPCRARKATGGNIQVSPAFNNPTRRPDCQAPIVVHEATHVVDGASGADPAHIPEWATNDPPISGKLAPGAIHNAAAGL
jgi:hypothetical protein